MIVKVAKRSKTIHDPPINQFIIILVKLKDVALFDDKIDLLNNSGRTCKNYLV